MATNANHGKIKQQQSLEDYKKFLAWIQNRIEDKSLFQMSLRQKQKLISKCLQISNDMDKVTFLIK